MQMFRAAKQRKREWQAKIEVKLAEKEERVRRRRAEVEALFDNAWTSSILTESTSMPLTK